MIHSHLQQPFPDDWGAAVRHMEVGHSVRVAPGVHWSRIAMIHADLHRSSGSAPADDRIGSGRRPDDNRPDSGS